MFLVFTGLVFSQEFGSITGKVLDQNGEPLPGVNISLTGGKIAPMSVISSTEGNFRFLSLPVAKDYTLKFELSGFTTVNREQLDVSFGRNVELKITMNQATLEEEVTVVGKTPVIDTKKTQVGVTITDEMIMSLPTARNPWVIMAMVPGMLISKEDVGGSEAGQQSSYSGHGSRGRDNTWSIDGANITDNSALGAAPAYVNIAGYEELQINYGNNDIKSQTGGVQLNIVSKRGGNAFSGTFFLDVERDAWQSSNATSELLSFYDTYNPGVDKIYLYGANFGGPIIKDRAWFYASWGIQDLGVRNIDGSSDKTWLTSGYGKVNFQITSSTRAEGFVEYDNKNKWGRLWHAASQSGPNHRWNQDGPGYIWKGELEQLFGDLYFNLKFIMMNGGFALHPVSGQRTSDGSGAYFIRDYTRPYYYGNIDDYGTNRDSYNVNMTGSYFLENLFGADHEIKFGVDYLTAATTTHDYYEGNVTIANYGADPTLPTGQWVEAWLLRDYFINVWMRRYSIYAQDTITFGNLTVGLGLRYDNERSMVKDENVPASLWLPKFMPAIKLTEFDPGVSWKVFSPRFSLIYDLTGDGKNVAKLNIARYGSQEGFGMAYFVNPIGWTEIDVLWQDLNGDSRMSSNELYGYDWGTGQVADVNNPDNWLWYMGMNPSNPTAVTARNVVDPKYNAPLIDELTLSFEHELITDLAARVEFFLKKDYRNIWSRRMLKPGVQPGASDLETSDNYFNAGTAEKVGSTIWGRTKYYPYQYRTNYQKRYARYRAAQFVLMKRLSNRWMLDASFTLASWRIFWNNEFVNPTNQGYLDGGVNASMNSRWQFKVSGLVQLPMSFNVSWVFRAREGYVWDTYVRERAPGIGNVSYYGLESGGGKRGDARRPNFYELDFRLEKVFHVMENGRVTVAFDAFNALNNHHPLELFSYIENASQFGKTSKILNPRVFRIGIRFDF